AEKVGVTVGAVYRYIGRKEDLLILVLNEILDSYPQAILPAIEGVEDPIRKLYRAIDGYYRVIDAQGRKVLLAYRESKNLSPAERDWLKKRELETNGLFARIVREGID